MRDVVVETWMVVLLGTALCVAALERDHAKVQAGVAREPRVIGNPLFAALDWAFWLTSLYFKSPYRVATFPPLKMLFWLVYRRLTYLAWQCCTYFF